MTEILHVAAPVWADQAQTTINLTVQFAHLAEPVPFTATQTDSVAYGTELFVRARFGEYGEVAPYQAPPTPIPTEEEQQRELVRRLQLAGDAIAPLADAELLGILTPAETSRLTALRLYRVTLSRLPETPGWPTTVDWPELPT
ncbi:tail fiber assembly protein [Aeromonas rivuli]|uniref:tail fiber assembly protein n=1 Tax=Aeromonas rivuli TaxID=648794 RepID=UPI0005A76BE1|nr:tail fiber assembly protein [Aeromonas rivuli]